MARRPDLLLTDYAGHAFTYELAVDLSSEGALDTVYSYCSTAVAPQGSLDGSVITVLPIASGRSFDKYNLRRRTVSELRYGLGSARSVYSTKPRVHVVANMPLLSLLAVWVATLPLRTPLVIWFQDVQSGLAAGILGDGIAAKVLSRLENFLLRRATRVIAISPELAEEANRRGVAEARLGVVENWAPVESINPLPRRNDWSRRHGLDEHTVYLYSGTLARKHDPSLLVELAHAVRETNGQVMVVTEGEGADYLRAELDRDESLDNLQISNYAPFAELPEVLASADVLIVLLEPLAGPFSVPSKTLSYLCSQRPVLASMPSSNTAAQILTARAKSGIVVEPGDREGFTGAALRLGDDPELRERLGAAGRQYAEEHFARPVILATMLEQLRLTSDL